MKQGPAAVPWWMYVGAASAAMAGISFPLDPLLVQGPAVDWDRELARLLGGSNDGELSER